jgi:hypothetical protein
MHYEKKKKKLLELPTLNPRYKTVRSLSFVGEFHFRNQKLDFFIYLFTPKILVSNQWTTRGADSQAQAGH